MAHNYVGESGQYDVVLKLLKDQFDLKNEIHNA